MDNKLSWFLGLLGKKYSEGTFYVHLKRNREDTARSFVKRYNMGIMKAYRSGIILGAEEDPIDVCRHYYDVVNSNIEYFMKTKKNHMVVHLETAEQDFQEFWDRIGATGDLSRALNEWSHKYNS
ncbi:hypothetical protein [Salinibacter ruber]|uniref:Uncharacterized protein n=1 Tax=Salinibacter ruber TaxID=146919 RepID=A0A9X2V8P5_9BACT|nr:hypothetical protein [Salinibacter ruber]MCS4122733.1 hypothetical protein [Salinibacter ruber]